MVMARAEGIVKVKRVHAVVNALQATNGDGVVGAPRMHRGCKGRDAGCCGLCAGGVGVAVCVCVLSARDGVVVYDQALTLHALRWICWGYPVVWVCRAGQGCGYDDPGET